MRDVLHSSGLMGVYSLFIDEVSRKLDGTRFEELEEAQRLEEEVFKMPNQ